MRCFPALLLAGLISGIPAVVRAESSRIPVNIVCAEAAWCDVAAQIGGPDVRTQALLSTPGIDPHDLTPSPSMARAMAGSGLAVVNGATYDDWALPFAASASDRIVVASIAGWHPGDNPHLFLDPAAVEKVARVLADKLSHQPGVSASAVDGRLNAFLKELDGVKAGLAAMKARHDVVSVAAVEPVGQTLLGDAGLDIVDESFALAIMNHAEPSPRDVAEVDTLIDGRRVRMLITNPAIHSPQIDRLVDRAQAVGLPVVAIGETLPPGQSWQGWVHGILQTVEQALGDGRQ
ncbi:metal ABC transporter solute-binding protein, Zn/Mn family [Gluconobacter kanchanaburiensis]|uniref:ABC transporter substrate-binding protein n=1 Tax=Gluconobacter kanchanaburiensis NBRC 103587 TaxID=1307948 RepID=A0A511BCG6_9PROT|nr:zinc ABC transporter substrate-binding protein [Gluconobacter kanchanaburiensis]MBF0861937.1 zinc ABC transporter solute-binding protein [Gluconobacter kanchanaburiensis]GBR67770.1 ABC transporter substrate-binding periplasmic protein [Gluconobacter kanchanaburiensis NBRC 103587]GEK95537.1 ABC transporter substrate-binding protein [Gluconobacter kanchanaburiensis NBRC 103587]